MMEHLGILIGEGVLALGALVAVMIGVGWLSSGR